MRVKLFYSCTQYLHCLSKYCRSVISTDDRSPSNMKRAKMSDPVDSSTIDSQREVSATRTTVRPNAVSTLYNDGSDGNRGGHFQRKEGDFPINPHLKDVSQSPTLRISEQVAGIRRANPSANVFNFGLGQSPFPVMKPMVDALHRNATAKDYLPTAGHSKLREKIAAYVSQRCGSQPRGADDVLVGDGTKMLLYLVQMALNADLLLPAPSWVTYEPQARMLGRRTLWIDTRMDEGWKITPENLEKTLQSHAQFSRNYATLCVLNYPSNPTGATYTRHELKDLAEVFRRHGVYVVSDEIYCRYTFDTNQGDIEMESGQQAVGAKCEDNEATQCYSLTEIHHSIAEFYPEGTIVLDGISKWAGAGGWRLGAFVFPPQLSWLRSIMVAAASETYSAVCAPIQLAAIEAFDGEKNGDYIRRYIDASNHVLSLISSYLTCILRSCKARVRDPQGGFYVFVDFSDCPGTQKARERFTESTGRDPEELTSEWLASDILSKTGVAMLPGAAFGCLPTHLVFRMAYVDFNGAYALKMVDKDLELPENTENVPSGKYIDVGKFYVDHPRAKNAFSNTERTRQEQNEFLRETCPRVIQGAAQLKRYLDGQ